MTPTRQPGKTRMLQACGISALLALALLVGPSRAAVTERVVTDIHTGVALDGYDPVAYFTDAQARVGRSEFEYRFKGVIWQFSNEGNRGAFAAHAEVYVPRFGGYDPVAIARGVAVAGNPTLWCIRGDRLYLFYSPADRDSFAADPANAIAAAEAKWPEVMQGLAQ
jgi:YHS domain-containing protein